MHSLPPLHAQASEIQVSAEEEFNIEKLQMVESEKQRIRREYERKEAQIESRKKIERSTKVNAARLRVLRAREECVSVAVKAAREQLAVVVGDQARYGRLLVELYSAGLAPTLPAISRPSPLLPSWSSCDVAAGFVPFVYRS